MQNENKSQAQLDEIVKTSNEEQRQRKFSVRDHRGLPNKVEKCLCCGGRAMMVGLKNERGKPESYIVSCLFCGRHTREKDTVAAARFEWELMQKLYEEAERNKALLREQELAEEEEAEEKKKEREAKGEGLGLNFSLSI